MPRDIDKRKTGRTLRKLRRAAEAAEGEGGPGLTAWERDFVDGVTERLETYGSAFRDPAKGRLEEALSHRQAQVTRVLAAKARKARPASSGDSEAAAEPRRPGGLQRRTPLRPKRKPAKT